MAIEGIIFDLDGTLVDTAPDLTAATNHALSLIGRRSISEAEAKNIVGHGSRALIKMGCEHTGGLVDEATLQMLNVAFLDYYAENIAGRSKIFPGVLSLLRKAKDHNLKLGVCTNKVERLSHKLLRELKLADYFGAVVGGDTLPIMKPDPAPYREVAARLGINPANSIMFGDSKTDIRTAQNAGVPVIAVTFGYTPQHVSTYNPTHIISHYDEAWPLITNYL
jgi:phosphoglycolate phosphatase